MILKLWKRISVAKRSVKLKEKEIIVGKEKEHVSQMDYGLDNVMNFDFIKHNLSPTRFLDRSKLFTM